MAEPIYSFSEGINYTVDIFSGERAGAQSGGHIAPAAMHELESQLTRSNPAYVQLRKEIEASEFASVTVPNGTGRKRQEVQFEYSLINPGAPSEAITAITLGWGTNYRRPGTARGIAALAMALDTPCVVMNPLGQGRSSNVPAAIAVADVRAGSYEGQGRLYGQALESLDLFREMRPRIGIAESRGMRLKMGALAAGEYTEDIGVYCDGTGFPALGFNGLRMAMKKESVHGREYGKAHQDPTAHEIDPEIQAYAPDATLAQLLRSGRLYQHYIRDVRTLGKSGTTDFEKALPHIQERAVILTLEASELTDSDRMRRYCGEVALKAPGVVEHVTAHGLTHLFGCSAGARALLLADRVFPRISQLA